MRRHLLLTTLLIAAGARLYAQGGFRTARNFGPVYHNYAAFRNSTLQLEGGNQGIGASLRYVALPFLAIRAGGSVGVASTSYIMSGDYRPDPDNWLHCQTNTFHILLEALPDRVIRLTGGLGYIDYKRSDVALVSEDKRILTKWHWDQIAPWFGVGIGRGVPLGMFNMNLDLGSYYLSSPSFKRVDDNGETIPETERENWMKNYRWLPMVHLNFNFRLVN